MPWSTKFNEAVERHVNIVTEVIKHIENRSYDFPVNEPDQVGEYFRAHLHPKLLNISDELKAAFTFALTQYWYRPSNMYNLFQTIPVAVLIGSGYSLNIDPEGMGKAVRGDYYQDTSGTQSDTNMPIAYEKHLDEWPEIKNLQSLSLTARFAFVRTLQYFDLRIGLAPYDKVNPRKISFIDEGLRDLVRAGLLRAKPNFIELLTCLTVRNLKQFAADEGVKVYGRKSEMAQMLVQQVSGNRIADYLATQGITDRYLQLNVSRQKSLKRYVWAEIHRIELYANWIEHVECLKMPPREHIGLPQTSFTRDSYFKHDPMMPDPYEPGNLDPVKIKEYARNHPTEIKLVQKIWDNNCDAILRKLVKKYAWYAARFIDDAIEEYLPSPVLQSFVDDCVAHGTSNWNWVLTYAGEFRILELGLNIPEPRLLTCAGCKTQFREWSIEWPIRERVNQQILFCKSCYQVACFHNARATTKSLGKKDMLVRLANLAEALETVPTVTYMQKPDLATLSNSQQIKVVRALLEMPSYADYIEQFDTWFQALNQAGVLQDGVQKTSRGYRCIANDGHECNSIPEKTIDDWLSMRGIKHEKEPFYPYDSHLNPSGLRADWQVGKTLIEYAGMMNIPEYAAKMYTKQELASKYDLPLIILEPEDILLLEERLSSLF